VAAWLTGAASAFGQTIKGPGGWVVIIVWLFCSWYCVHCINQRQKLQLGKIKHTPKEFWIERGVVLFLIMWIGFLAFFVLRSVTPFPVR
jgi:hypothetical protein